MESRVLFVKTESSHFQVSKRHLHTMITDTLLKKTKLTSEAQSETVLLLKSILQVL